ncbi:hypothetical protein EON80_22615 [bacterium]|nr:MAG: hypothetical protein EON80_22615 [bacterium]
MRSGFCGLVALSIIGGLYLALPSQAADEYRTYFNARFGTTLQYPANLVTPQPESQNGDGRRFLSKDGAIELTVYGSHNALGRTVKTQMERAIADWKRDGARLTFQKYGPGWYALSGYSGDDIFYEKALFQNGDFHTIIWQYPKEYKARLDVPVTRTVRTFAVGKGLETTSAQPTPRPKKSTRPAARPKKTRPTAVPTSSPGGY